MINRRGKFVNIAVLGFYLCYALLPLLYSTGSAHPETRGNYGCSSPPAALRSIPAQSTFLVPVPEQDTDDSSASADILLKKKRALAPSIKDVVAKLFSHYANPFDSEHFLKVSLVPSQIPDHTQNCPNGYTYYHSGISPPSV